MSRVVWMVLAVVNESVCGVEVSGGSVGVLVVGRWWSVGFKVGVGVGG